MKKIDVNNPCTEKTCQNGGTCYEDNLMNTHCFCSKGFDGKYCENDKRPTTTTTFTAETTTTTTIITEQYSKLKLYFFLEKNFLL